QRMMLGVIFVVHTSIGGDKLVFRYPAVTRAKVSDETMMAFRQQHPIMTPSKPGGGGAVPGGVTNESDNKAGQDQSINPNSANLNDPYYIYNLSSEILTPILTPKTTLCDKPFELMIENTKFIGHPIMLSNDDSDDNEDDDDDDQHHNGDPQCKGKSMASGARNSSKAGAGAGGGAGGGGSNGHQHNQTTHLNNKSDMNSSSSSVNSRSVNSSSSSVKSSKDGHDEITMFNFVFVLSSNIGEANDRRDDSLKRSALKIASAFRHEQQRCNYISKQVHDIFAIRDGWLTEHTLDTIDDKPNHQELTNRILKSSKLGPEIKLLFDSLNGNNAPSSIRINGWINLHLNINNVDYYSDYPMRPYHALLIYSDSLPVPPGDSSPALQRLLEVTKPTKSFRDLQLETDLPLSLLYRLSSHLVYWRKAKIINMLTKNNVYILTPISGEQKINYLELGNKFTQAFPDFMLQDILLRFSVARPLAEHISKFHQSYHVMFLSVVCWLLEKGLITQLHTYIHLMIRLVPYFRGQHHLEEIMWRENISRDDLNKILKKYKNFLIQVTHEGEDQNKVQ
ncbi:hypothetical protein SAMD00019534_002760, partial [Acytostelium subglobosum LB1]|uniref:hypothetical protein n=1 Tax=Acytostelium subglobosum LB1 TaxID=1410327 RepID=UPI0006448739